MTITLDEAREIAYAWHGGVGSPLYSFASTSNDGTPRNITPDTVSEVNGNIRWCLFNGRTEEAKERPQLEQLAEFLTANMPEQPEEDEIPEDCSTCWGVGELAPMVTCPDCGGSGYAQ